MKKLFTVDDFIVAGISGIGYGLGCELLLPIEAGEFSRYRVKYLEKKRQK